MTSPPWTFTALLSVTTTKLEIILLKSERKKREDFLLSAAWVHPNTFTFLCKCIITVLLCLWYPFRLHLQRLGAVFLRLTRTHYVIKLLWAGTKRKIILINRSYIRSCLNPYTPYSLPHCLFVCLVFRVTPSFSSSPRRDKCLRPFLLNNLHVFTVSDLPQNWDKLSSPVQPWPPGCPSKSLQQTEKKRGRESVVRLEQKLFWKSLHELHLEPWSLDTITDEQREEESSAVLSSVSARHLWRADMETKKESLQTHHRHVGSRWVSYCVLSVGAGTYSECTLCLFTCMCWNNSCLGQIILLLWWALEISLYECIYCMWLCETVEPGCTVYTKK